LSEWWIVGGVLTEAEGSEEVGTEMIAINGYFQVIDGYKPNVESGTQKVRYSLNSSIAYVMTDRTTDTHSWYLALSWGFPATPNSLHVWIPVWETDYGVLSIPGNNAYLSNNVVDNFTIQIYSSTGAATTQTISLNGYDIEALPVYPANLNDWTIP